MKYFYLMVVSSIFTLNAMAMQDDNTSESQISVKKPQLSPHTVMNPNGVTQDEWKEMFEGERRSIIEDVAILNKDIELVNNAFKICPQERLNRFIDLYRQREGREPETNIYFSPS